MENDIVERLLDEARKKGAQSITLEVGDLADPGAIVIRKRLTAEGLHVEIVSKRGIIQCLCGYYGEPHMIEQSEKGTYFVCPSCGNYPGIVQGDEIILKNII
jgi:Zn finger protein HypA/HybF involved in hydrogenase expression